MDCDRGSDRPDDDPHALIELEDSSMDDSDDDASFDP